MVPGFAQHPFQTRQRTGIGGPVCDDADRVRHEREGRTACRCARRDEAIGAAGFGQEPELTKQQRFAVDEERGLVAAHPGRTAAGEDAP